MTTQDRLLEIGQRLSKIDKHIDDIYLELKECKRHRVIMYEKNAQLAKMVHNKL